MAWKQHCRQSRHKAPICATLLQWRAGTNFASFAARYRQEHAQTRNLQAQLDHLRGRIHQLEAQLAVPSVDRAIGRALKRVRKTGDRLTGGGLRSLARRALTNLVQRSMRDRRLMALGKAVLKPFPKVATTLYQLAAKEDAAATSSIPSPARSLPLRRCCHRGGSAGLSAVRLPET